MDEARESAASAPNYREPGGATENFAHSAADTAVQRRGGKTTPGIAEAPAGATGQRRVADRWNIAMTSRVRCSCGRIYDPVKHAACPDCGAESAVESVVVAEKVKPPAPPETSAPGQTAPSAPWSPGSFLRSLPVPVLIGAGALIVLVLFLL